MADKPNESRTETTREEDRSWKEKRQWKKVKRNRENQRDKERMIRKRHQLETHRETEMKKVGWEDRESIQEQEREQTHTVKPSKFFFFFFTIVQICLIITSVCPSVCIIPCLIVCLVWLGCLIVWLPVCLTVSLSDCLSVVFQSSLLSDRYFIASHPNHLITFVMSLCMCVGPEPIFSVTRQIQSPGFTTGRNFTWAPAVSQP